MTVDEAVAELISRMLQGKPLLPLPEASQDLALLAFRIQQQDAALTRLREMCEREIGRNAEFGLGRLRPALYVDEVLSVLDGEPDGGS